MRVIAVFNLKADVTPAAYEEWARTRDIPGVRALPSIDDFRVYRTTGSIPGTPTPPYQYIEIIDIADLDGFGIDAGSDAMAILTREFAAYTDAPAFMLTEQID